MRRQDETGGEGLGERQERIGQQVVDLIRPQRRTAPRSQDIDRHVGARVRERRIMLGFTQQQLADLNSTMNESLSVSGVLLTKVSGRRQMTFDKFTSQNQKLTDTTVYSATLLEDVPASAGVRV